VVVGTRYRQTPVFSDRLSYLVFNPYWHVPPRIATQDRLPEFRRDPSLVSRLGFEVLDGWGPDARTVDPSTIDWGRLSADNFPYRLRQRPGPANALGRVKFMFPNRHNVYLHDTPARSLFGRTERGFSSGCIRVERPVDLATYLLRDNEGWTEARVRSEMSRSTERTVVLQQKVPVHLLYWTAWPEDGTLHFRNDIYRRDEAVASALAAPPAPRSLSESGGP
jgi:murein L,D-transpeptidase YcbB/YkuD